MIFGYIQIPANLFFQFLFTGCLYVIPVFVLNLLIPNLSKGNQVEQLHQEINSMKANEDAFKSLLRQQPFYEVSTSDSQILFGNPDAAMMITILTNPFCNPCAKMHTRVEHMLRETKGEVCFQYIFSAFDESLLYANRYLIAAYLTPPSIAKSHHSPHSAKLEGTSLERQREVICQLYNDWFTKGKEIEEEFFSGLQLDMTNPAIEIEFQKHQAWKEKTQLHATPTILINGYKLPESYKIEDLRYLSEFDFEI